MPPGVQPPEIINYSASSVPILQLGLSGKGLSEQQLNDYGLNFVRTQLITVPGAVVPYPYGGKQRQVTISMDQGLMQSKGISPIEVLNAVNSPRVKALYDIYHMQIMEGDLVATIQKNIDLIGHFHTGGVPGRHELDGTQEVQWDGVMRGIAATTYKGYVAHEFVPSKDRDPLISLRQAVDLCDV